MKLAQAWSPEQSAGWLKRTYPDEGSLHLSHETIYKGPVVQSRDVLKKELQKHFRTKLPFREFRQHNNKCVRRGQVTDGVPISEHPPGIEVRTVPCHWKGF